MAYPQTSNVTNFSLNTESRRITIQDLLPDKKCVFLFRYENNKFCFSIFEKYLGGDKNSGGIFKVVTDDFEVLLEKLEEKITFYKGVKNATSTATS